MLPRYLSTFFTKRGDIVPRFWWQHHALSRFDQIGHDQANRQCKGRHHFKVLRARASWIEDGGFFFIFMTTYNDRFHRQFPDLGYIVAMTSNTNDKSGKD